MSPSPLYSFDFSEQQKQAASQRALASIDLKVRELSVARVTDNQFIGQHVNEQIGTSAFQSARNDVRKELTETQQQSIETYQMHMHNFHRADASQKAFHLASADVESQTCYPGMVPPERVAAATTYLATGRLQGYAPALTSSMERSQAVDARATAAQHTPPSQQDSIETTFNRALLTARQQKGQMDLALHGKGREAGIVADAYSADPARTQSGQAVLAHCREATTRVEMFQRFKAEHNINHFSELSTLPAEQQQAGMHLFSAATEAKQKFLDAASQHRQQYPALDRATDNTLIERQSMVHDTTTNINRSVAERQSNSVVLRVDGQTVSAAQHYDKSASRQREQSHSQAAALSR